MLQTPSALDAIAVPAVRSKCVAAPSRRRALAGLLCALATAGGIAPAGAETYPSQPVRIIVAFPAGGAADTVTRLLGKELEKSLRQPVVVENKPGALTFVAVQALLAAKPDGYTFMAVSNDTLMVNPHLVKAPYDIRQSFDYVGTFGDYAPAVLVARRDFPAQDAKEVIDYLRNNPGKVNIASHGKGSTSHIRAELLLAKLGVKQNHVPYRGGAPALQDLAGGQVDLLVDSPVSSMPMIRAGRIKALANMGRERNPDLPSVATLAEVGASAGDFVTFQALIAPKGLPPAVLKSFSDALRTAMANPELRDVLGTRGLKPAYREGAEFQAMVMDGSEMMRQVIAQNQITAD